MDTLIRYGFTIDEVKLMMDSISFLFSFDDKDIESLLHFLETLQCDEDIIKNIFICNPFCFTKDVDEIKKVIEKLKEHGIKSFATLLDSNPYILNKTDKEIDNFYQKKIKEGYTIDKINDMIFSIVQWVLL